MKNSRGQACEAKRVSTKALDQTVIENLLTHVLTIENLRTLAKNIAQSLEERSSDVGTRIAAIEDKLAEVKKSLENIMDALENYMRDALEGEDKALARRIIQQFEAKIVIKEGTGILYYTFPDDSYMPSFRDLDLRGFEPLTSTVRL